jgi:nucleoside-diphosphate-sugar epimerase
LNILDKNPIFYRFFHKNDNQMKTYNIGIGCIGSGVGQSVISSLRLSNLPLKTIGLGTNPFGYGAYDCDRYDYTPSIYSDNYIDEVVRKCHQYDIELLIPGLDDEVLVYARNEDKLNQAGIKAIFSAEPLVKICRDKELMSIELNKVADVFVKSFNKSTIEEGIESGLVNFPVIAKLREGFSSKGVEIIRDREALARITNRHILQEIAIPGKSDPNYISYMDQIEKNCNSQVSEISIQLVVGPEGNYLGRMASYNKLNNGIPIEIVPFENDLVYETIDKLMPTFLKLGLRGPLNIQGRITANGLKLFEMNPRFTGITGLRALMGFNEVEACVKEWMGIDKGNNFLKINRNRFGMRQTADKSVSIDRNEQIIKLVKQIHPIFTEKQKTILVTGATGYLGQGLINDLYENRKYKIMVFARDKGKIPDFFKGKICCCFDKKDFDFGILQLGNIDVLLHLGFSRPHCSNGQIAESLAFTHELFTQAAMNQVPAIINISSQSVYGLENLPPWNEQTPVAPTSVYAQAKYSTELHLKSLKRLFNHVMISSIRLGAIAGGTAQTLEYCFLSKIVRQAMDGECIKIIGGYQEIERLDLRDAVAGLIAILQIDPLKWRPVYNLGSGDANNLLKIAQVVVDIASGFNGGIKSEIVVEEKPINMRFGLDSSLFMKDTGWKPIFSLEDIITSLIKRLNCK